MAYAAVISLEQTILRLAISIVQQSRENPVSSNEEVKLSPEVHKTVEILAFGLFNLKCLQDVVKRLDDSSRSSKRLNALDGQIKDEVQKIEDLLEFHESNQFLLQSENYGDDGFYHTLAVEINSFVETVKKMEEEYVKELDDPSPEEEEEDDDDAAVSSSSSDFGVKMVGFSDEFKRIKNQMLRSTKPYDFGVCSIVGTAGSGRTVAAKALFEDLFIGQEQSFECGAWVTIGATYQLKEILVAILAQIDPSSKDELPTWEGNEEIVEYLRTSLEGRRYIIVLDDVRDIEIRDLLTSSFPKQDNGSLVMLTTSLKEVALFADSFLMPALDEARIWELLCLGLFGVQSCPPELEEALKKIAENCQGLRILLAKVILFLFKAEKMPEYWNKVAADTENSIFMVADELLEICKIKEDLQLCNSYGDDDERRWATSMITSALDFSVGITGIKTRQFPERLFPKMEINSIIGMAGIGKTTLVKEIFEDQSILYRFDHRVWITLGPKYRPQEILVDILSQIYTDIDKMHLKGDEKLAKDLCTQLSDKRCLIMLDDVWNQEPLHYLKKLWPDIKGKALVTTRITKVGNFGPFDWVLLLRFLSKEESWYLLRQKVLAEEMCPPELQKPGEKIAEKCGGLPLLILTVANLLSEAEKTAEYWNSVAENKNSSIFVNAQNEISKALVPSYKSLPQHLKACFLYMGVFPQNYDIPTSKLTKLWIAEGFLETNPYKTVEHFAAECFLELLDRNLVMVRQKGSTFTKTCGLHSIFWHLSNSEAARNNFFLALNTYGDNSVEGIESQRRLCIRNSILFAIKDLDNSTASISTARSLLFTGPPNKYPVPICLGLRLLRILDALTIRLYEFPIDVVKLIHLRYLALTCNGELPASISKLRNLEYLIVRRHLSIESSRDLSYLPLEIWDMKNLKHLQVMGSNLLHYPNCGTLLPNLLTLLDVNSHGCAKEILERIPNLMRLGIRIELAPDDDGKPFSCLNHIFHLSGLESLKCIVVNPELSSEVFTPPFLSMFPSSLRKLHLSGLGYPWEYMSIIASLPNLEVLKLRCYAFQGPVWESGYSDFQKLKLLLIEDTDLMRWNIKLGSFPKLESLCINHCYKLEAINWEYSDLCRLIEKIQIFDCNPSVVTWAKNFKSIFHAMLGNSRSIDCEIDPKENTLVLASFDPTTSSVGDFFT